MSAPLLLASASPRRRHILSRLGLSYHVAVPPFDEDAALQQYLGPLDELAVWLARHKAVSAHTLPAAVGAIVITADTTVLLDDKELGKPRNPQHAQELLLALRNRWHTVITGVTVSKIINGKVTVRSASCATPVLMRPYSAEEISAYIATGDPLDKAGAYGIQHASFQPTARIQGCYLNVVGLPLCVLATLLAEFGVFPPAQHTPPGSPCRWSEKCLVALGEA